MCLVNRCVSVQRFAFLSTFVCLLSRKSKVVICCELHHNNCTHSGARNVARSSRFVWPHSRWKTLIGWFGPAQLDQTRYLRVWAACGYSCRRFNMVTELVFVSLFTCRIIKTYNRNSVDHIQDQPQASYRWVKADGPESTHSNLCHLRSFSLVYTAPSFCLMVSRTLSYYRMKSWITRNTYLLSLNKGEKIGGESGRDLLCLDKNAAVNDSWQSLQKCTDSNPEPQTSQHAM